MSKLKDTIVKLRVFKNTTLPPNETNYDGRAYFICLGAIDYILVDKEKNDFKAVLGSRIDVTVHKDLLQTQTFKDLMASFKEIKSGLDTTSPSQAVYINPDNIVSIWLHGDQAEFEMKYSGDRLATTKLNEAGSLEPWLENHTRYRDLTSTTDEGGKVIQQNLTT